MPHPDVDQITSTVRDFDRALAGPVRCAFDGGWAEELPADVSTLFDDPDISPFYERGQRVRQAARTHLAAGTADIANPLRPEEGTHRVAELVNDSDPLAVFVADPQTVYVLSDVPLDGTELAIPSPWPTELRPDADGRRVFRLTDRLGGILVGHRDGIDRTYVEPLDAMASVGQQFAHRVRYGTLPSACDFRLTPGGCEGATALVVQQCGLWVLVWSTCQPCNRTAVQHVEHAYAASGQAAWAAVREDDAQ